MHGLDQMTREELLELAPLDALGLLDEVEAALFDRGFRQAAVTVQAEIVALQSELVASDSFLADEHPRAILRRKVLLRLEEVMDEAAEHLKPLAHIGAQIGAQTGSPTGTKAEHVSAGRADEARDPVQLAAFRALMEEFAERNARAAERTTPFWRAAAIMMLAALVVSIYFQVQTSRYAREVSEMVITQGVEHQIGVLVPRLHDYSTAAGLSFAMAPSDAAKAAGRSSAMVLCDTAGRQVLMATFGLGRIQPGAYRCRAIDQADRVEEFASIEADRFLACGVGTLPEGFTPVRYELVDPQGVVVFSAKV